MCLIKLVLCLNLCGLIGSMVVKVAPSGPFDPNAYALLQRSCVEVTALQTSDPPDTTCGSNPYSYESPIRTAAIITGALQRGQTKKIVVNFGYGSMQLFGQTKNGVTSSSCPYAYYRIYWINDLCCEDGFYIHQTDQSCHACGTLGCETCDDSISRCSSCLPGYIWVPLGIENTYPSCLPCPFAQFSLGNRSTECQSCFQNCDVCVDQITCRTCMKDHILSADGKSCIINHPTLETVKMTSQTAQVINSIIPITSIALSLPTTASLFLPLTSILNYIKFLRLSYSERLLDFFQEPNPLEFSPPDPLINAMNFPTDDSDRLQIQFVSFLLNSWQYLLSLSFFLVLVLTLTLLSKCFRSRTKVFRSITQLREKTLEIFLTQFFGGYTDVTFFLIHTVMQSSFKTMEFMKGLDLTIAIICKLSLFIIFLLLFKKSSTFLMKWRLDVLSPPKENKGRDFQLFFTTRNLFIAIIIHPDLRLEEKPLIQALLLVCFSIVFLTYLCIRRPFKEHAKAAERQCFAFEVILLIVNLSVLILALSEQICPHEWQMKVSSVIDQTIIISNSAISILTLIFLIYSMLTILFKKLKFRKSQRTLRPRLFMQQLQLQSSPPQILLEMDRVIMKPLPAKIQRNQGRTWEFKILSDGIQVKKRFFGVKP